MGHKWTKCTQNTAKNEPEAHIPQVATQPKTDANRVNTLHYIWVKQVFSNHTRCQSQEEKDREGLSRSNDDV